MKPHLGVSNLAWPAHADTAVMPCLPTCGVEGIEVAPTRIAPWEDLTTTLARRFRQDCKAHGLVVPSMQAIFYARPDLQLLGNAQAFSDMCKHMYHLAQIAEALGATVAVFGAPKNRLRGALTQSQAMELAAERLSVLGDIAAAGGLVLGMEPVPGIYGGDFLQRAEDVIELVHSINNPHVQVHLDTACITLAGDSPRDAIQSSRQTLIHYHVSEPNLSNFDSPFCSHDSAGRALKEIKYSRWIVIEMLDKGEFMIDFLRNSINFVQNNYIHI
ncbi:sugar phosphate isomerase/epimerase family protein [Granulibacter bethesdensis]|uniref:sugar phosphate isomerase/epimerase family protein n=1 Tax=Granulibacter bethesdensis TaxID=364410 RepID=UPI00090AEEBA|nr:sugar phosphate isomerase/epimerase family protein [Granulibacter bethesdensis]APH59851.1 Hypothetical protein GbCGDNIH7_8353 [Granulibacter bethesdensis]